MSKKNRPTLDESDLYKLLKITDAHALRIALRLLLEIFSDVREGMKGGRFRIHSILMKFTMIAHEDKIDTKSQEFCKDREHFEAMLSSIKINYPEYF